MKKRAWFAVVLAALLSCTAEPIAVDYAGESKGIKPATGAGMSNIISDGRTDGSPDFYFLFPIVPERPPRDRPFDAGAAPTVTICRLVNGACAETVAEFPYADKPGLGLRTTRQWSRFEFYLATWLTPASKAGQKFRVTVKAYGLELGFADVQLVRRLSELRSVPSDVVGVLAGLPLPVAFRIEVAVTSKLAVIQQPVLERDGVPFVTSLVVELQDASGRRALTSAAPVSVSLALGTGTLLGTKTVVAVNGRATFGDLQYNGTGFAAFTASAPGVAPIQSDTVSIAARALPIDSTQLSLIQDEVGQASGVYAFELLGTGRSIDSGTIIVGAQGKGFLRRVIGVSTSSNRVTLRTTRATIDELGLTGEITASASPFALSSTSLQSQGRASRLAVRPTAIPSITIPIGVCGTVTLSELEVTPGWDIDTAGTILLNDQYGRFQQFTLTLEGTLSLDGRIEATTTCSTGPGKVSVDASISTPKLPPVFLGPVPVFLEASIGVAAGLEAPAANGMGTDFHSTRTLSARVTCDRSPTCSIAWEPSAATTSTSQSIEDLKVDVSVEFGAGAGVSALIGGVVGPSFSVGPYVRFAGKTDPLNMELNLSCNTGWSLGASVEFDVFDRDWLSLSYEFASIDDPDPPFCQKKLPYWGTVAGTLGSPQRGALVGVTVAASTTSVQVTSQIDGSYLFPRLPTGAVDLSLSGLPTGCTIPGPTSVEVRKEATTTQDFIINCTSPPPSGGAILAHYPLDQDGSDVASQPVNGVPTNVSIVPGRIGNAMHFSGGASYLDIPIAAGSKLALQSTDQFSAAMWIRPTQVSGSVTGYPLTAGQSVFGWGIQALSGTPTINACTPATFCYNAAGPAGSVAPGAWTHIAYLFDGQQKTIQIYVNGQAYQTTSTKFASVTTDRGISLGAAVYNTAFSFTGDIDEVRFYSGLLTATEIQGLANPTGGTQASALQFNGSSGYVTIPGSTAFDVDQFTAEAWVRLSRDVGPQQARIVNRQSSQGGPESWGLEVFGQGYAGTTGNQVVFHSADCTIGAEVRSVTRLQPGIWYHIAGVNDGVNLRLYVNGQLEAQAPGRGIACKPLGVPIRIGVTGPLGQFYWPGEIDEVRFWSVARSAAQIAASYRSHLTGQEAGLVGYWSFDDASGSVAIDGTGRGNNGTLVNGPVWVSESWQTVTQTSRRGQARRAPGTK